MSTIKDGGSAFPATNYIIPRDLEERHVAALGKTQGMTLRDYFASKAMQGFLANPGGAIQANGMTGWGYVNCREVNVAAMAYDMADAMLRAREVQP